MRLETRLGALAAFILTLSPALASAHAGLAPVTVSELETIGGRVARGTFSLGRVAFGRRSSNQFAQLTGTTRVDGGGTAVDTRESAQPAFGRVGVDLRDLTQGTDVMIVDEGDLYEGTAVDAAGASGDVLTQTGRNGEVCFTMAFRAPVQSVSFDRVALRVGPNGVSHPWWRATARDASGAALAGQSVGENKLVCLRGEPACRTVDDAGQRFVASAVVISGQGDASVAAATRFELSAPSIGSVRVCSDTQDSAFSALVFENLTFTRR
ncbi:MAG: hypothetical protein SF051_08925 [Elusimicrobiota bacterium]|nr:hypothetical protein [Elusimicrobiota bacterium]